MSQKDDELLKLTSYVEISKYREKTLKSIGNNVKIPTNIAKDSGIRTNHISKVLSELKSKEIVECINEEARKGRLYRLTDTGKEVLAHTYTFHYWLFLWCIRRYCISIFIFWCLFIFT